MAWPHNGIITGVLNLHVNNKYDVEARKICSILDLHGLTQHINR